jgi:hypothetical protein
MTDPSLEERLRSGLTRAADALPQGPPVHLSESRSSRKPVLAAAAALAVVAVGAAGIVMLRNGDDGEPTLSVAEEGESDTDEPPAPTVPPEEVRAANGQAPGDAVLVGGEIRLYDSNGGQTGTVDVAPLEHPQDISSDLNGGWVVCGADAAMNDYWIWFPADGEPV